MRLLKIFCLILIYLILMPVACIAESSSALVNKGISAYENKQYDEALKAFEAAGVDNPESPQIYFNKGAAYYRKGEYDKAKEAWEKSALNTKDISLEARSLFNLGNTAFQEAQRQQDSDLKKAIDACTQSIGYYQQALDLLNNPENNQDSSLVKDASENIELVRLVMKSMIDAMAKQQEQDKQQQQTEEELKDLIKKQQELIDRNNYYNQEKIDKGDSKQLNENISQMAGDQDRLREDTKKTADKMPTPDPSKPDPSAKAKEHLNKAQSEQQTATDNMTGRKLSDAAANQESALQELKAALESMDKNNGQGKKQEEKNPQGQQGKQEESQSKGDQAKEQTSDEQEKQQSNQQQQEQQGMSQDKNQDSKKWIGSPKDDAQNILDEEKENQKNRLPETTGGFHDVDKDW
jgi:Ca-activated chloride channel homolog